jgi:RHS repeat-associated protein
VVQVTTAERATVQSFPVFLAPPTRTPLPGTHVYLLENSRLGFEPFVTAQQPGLPPGNQQNALRFPAELRQTHVRSRYTGKERDAESGLDFFGARYFSGGQGRFTSADPLLNSAHPWNPQTWNRYAYGLNNPLKFTDPTGLYNVIDHCGDDKKCEKKFQKSATELSKAVDKLQKAVDKMKDGAEKARLRASLKALGTSGDENNVYVSFTALSGTTAGTTESTQNHQSNDTGMQNFNVTLDPSKNSDTSTMAINAAHEGTHVSDFETEQNPLFMGTVLMPFQLEYRGYQTSSYAAEALGEPSWATDNGRNVIWNSSWAAADRATQRDTGITNHVVDKDHPEVQPHNPWPN